MQTPSPYAMGNSHGIMNALLSSAINFTNLITFQCRFEVHPPSEVEPGAAQLARAEAEQVGGEAEEEVGLVEEAEHRHYRVSARLVQRII